jgi:hypothetical protein
MQVKKGMHLLEELSALRRGRNRRHGAREGASWNPKIRKQKTAGLLLA